MDQSLERLANNSEHFSPVIVFGVIYSYESAGTAISVITIIELAVRVAELTDHER